MGKSKQRSFAKAKNQKKQFQISRQEALIHVYEELTDNPSSVSAKKMITLFGLRAEELSEVGITYEVLRSLDGLIY